MKSTKSPISLLIIYWVANFLLVGLIILLTGIFTRGKGPAPQGLSEDSFAMANSVVNIVAVLVIFLAFVSLLIFRKLILNIKGNQTFVSGNIRRLRILSFSLIAFCLLSALQKWLFFIFLAPALHLEMQEIWNSFNYFLLFLALFFLALGHVFSIGLKLQRERDLTI